MEKTFLLFAFLLSFLFVVDGHSVPNRFAPSYRDDGLKSADYEGEEGTAADHISVVLKEADDTDENDDDEHRLVSSRPFEDHSLDEELAKSLQQLIRASSRTAKNLKFATSKMDGFKGSDNYLHKLLEAAEHLQIANLKIKNALKATNESQQGSSTTVVVPTTGSGIPNKKPGKTKPEESETDDDDYGDDDDENEDDYFELEERASLRHFPSAEESSKARARHEREQHFLTMLRNTREILTEAMIAALDTLFEYLSKEQEGAGDSVSGSTDESDVTTKATNGNSENGDLPKTTESSRWRSTKGASSGKEGSPPLSEFFSSMFKGFSKAHTPKPEYH